MENQLMSINSLNGLLEVDSEEIRKKRVRY